MVKLDLKDAYLAIPVAQESWNLLTFQAGLPHNLMLFQYLPIRIFTSPFTFSKATKPTTQFLHQLRICLERFHVLCVHYEHQELQLTGGSCDGLRDIY